MILLDDEDLCSVSRNLLSQGQQWSNFMGSLLHNHALSRHFFHLLLLYQSPPLHVELRIW